MTSREFMSKVKKPLEEEKTVKYDPVVVLKTALASAGASSDVLFGGYAMSIYWIKQTLETLEATGKKPRQGKGAGTPSRQSDR